ncbi:hypothetical protein D2Q93_16630 [Alicyclobacillaceae bacterium I2511]|nr:hypothetical protein D2Q93_16630 [Alicyclobacillaceae bacterium I2511]
MQIQDKYRFIRHGFFNVDPKETTTDHKVFNLIVSLKSSFKIEQPSAKRRPEEWASERNAIIAKQKNHDSPRDSRTGSWLCRTWVGYLQNCL